MAKKKPWVKPELIKLNFPNTESGKNFNEQEQQYGVSCHVTVGLAATITTPGVPTTGATPGNMMCTTTFTNMLKGTYSAQSGPS